ncbi:hypothetical protein KBD34_04375 [Patescibacteria group bacterium]|nr:hypothetical protein [Patescibacteria group bacterium]
MDRERQQRDVFRVMHVSFSVVISVFLAAIYLRSFSSPLSFMRNGVTNTTVERTIQLIEYKYLSPSDQKALELQNERIETDKPTS